MSGVDSAMKENLTGMSMGWDSAVIAVLLVHAIYKADKKNKGHFVGTVALYLGNLVESGIWAMLYCFFGFTCGHIPEHLFPPFDGTHKYWWPELMLEVCLQAAASVMVAQVVQDLVHLFPVPDIGHDSKALTASGGGIIFASISFARQTNFKNKLAFLVKLCDSDFLVSKHVMSIFAI